MPHKSSGRSARRSAARRSRSPRPSTVHHVPPPAHVPASSDESILGSIGSTIGEGMAFGTGSAVAHRATNATMGPRIIQHETVSTGSVAAQPGAATSTSVGDSCGIHSRAFQDCLNNNGSDINKCQFYLDMLNECRRNSGSITGA